MAHLNLNLRLVDLSSDVIVNILKFVKPHHIISFRQVRIDLSEMHWRDIFDLTNLPKTCRAFYRITRLQSVWKNALRTVMYTHLITEDSYPLSSMSLAALEHAALAPRRFIEVLVMNMGTGGHCLEPTQIRDLPWRLTGSEGETYGSPTVGELDDFRVAPGGRYLIVTSKHSIGILPEERFHMFTLWDVGLSHLDKVKVLGRMEKFGDSAETCRLHDLYFDAQSGGLYLIFSCIAPVSTSKVYVYKIILSPSSAPKFVQLVEKPINENCSLAVSRELNRIVGHFWEEEDGHSFLVWDFVNRKGASWQAPDCSFDPDAGVVLHPFKDTLIVASHSKDIMIYNIPEMGHLRSSKLVSLSAALVIKNPLSGSGYYSLGSSLHSSYTQERPYICISDNKKLFIYQIKNIAAIFDPSIPKNLPINIGSFDNIHLLEEFFYFNFLDNMDEEHLIMCYVSDDAFNLWVSVVSLNGDGIPLALGEGGSRSLGGSKALGYGGSVEMKRMHVCSASGRFFLISESRLQSLQVFDYLRYPA